MAFTYTRKKIVTLATGVKLAIGTFDSAGVATGDIVTGLKHITHFDLCNKTGVRASTAIDTTTTAGTATPSGLTAGDVGTWAAYGQ